MIDIEPYISLECGAPSRLARRIYEIISAASAPVDVCEIRDEIGASPGAFGTDGSVYMKALHLLIEVGLVVEIIWWRERTGFSPWIEKRITYRSVA